MDFIKVVDEECNNYSIYPVSHIAVIENSGVQTMNSDTWIKFDNGVAYKISSISCLALIDWLGNTNKKNHIFEFNCIGREVLKKH